MDGMVRVVDVYGRVLGSGEGVGDALLQASGAVDAGAWAVIVWPGQDVDEVLAGARADLEWVGGRDG